MTEEELTAIEKKGATDGLYARCRDILADIEDLADQARDGTTAQMWNRVKEIRAALDKLVPVLDRLTSREKELG